MLYTASSEPNRYEGSTEAPSPLDYQKSAIEYLEEIYGALPQLPSGRRLFPVVRGSVQVNRIVQHISLVLGAEELSEDCSLVENTAFANANSLLDCSVRTQDVTKVAQESWSGNELESQFRNMATDINPRPQPRIMAHPHAFESHPKRRRLDTC